MKLFWLKSFVIIAFIGLEGIYAEEPTSYDYGNDPMRYLENDRIKLGINLSIGGAVTYLTDAKNGAGNMINSADWGRQIQLSYYSGPNPYLGPNGEKPSSHWAGLGWNPIQSGDCAGNRSQVIEFKQLAPDQFYVKTIPMLWPNDNIPGECTFECYYTLKENCFILDATINVNRDDKTQYPGRSQEMPALYTNGPWYKLVSYLGRKPFENEPLTTIVDKNDGKGWPWVCYYSPERWSALMAENGYGIGVYQKDSVRTTAGFSGGDNNKGTGDEKSGPTGYIAPLSSMILDWNISKSYRAVFILGTLDEIRKEANALALADLSKTPKWLFENDRENWIYAGTVQDEGFPVVQKLNISFKGKKDDAMIGPQTYWLAEDASRLEIDAAFMKDDESVTENQEIKIVITPVADSDCIDYLAWSEGNKDAKKDRQEKEKIYPALPELVYSLPVKFNGKRQIWALNLSSEANYAGPMKALKITFPTISGRAAVYQVQFLK